MGRTETQTRSSLACSPLTCKFVPDSQSGGSAFESRGTHHDVAVRGDASRSSGSGSSRTPSRSPREDHLIPTHPAFSVHSPAVPTDGLLGHLAGCSVGS